MSTVNASEFKAKCLQMMDDVAQDGKTITITKHGKPVAKIVPCHVPAASLYGFLRGQIKYRADDSLDMGGRS